MARVSLDGTVWMRTARAVRMNQTPAASTATAAINNINNARNRNNRRNNRRSDRRNRRMYDRFNNHIFTDSSYNGGNNLNAIINDGNNNIITIRNNTHADRGH